MVTLVLSLAAIGARASGAPVELTKGAVPSWVEPLAWQVPTTTPDDAAAQVILADGQAKLFPNGGDYYFHEVVRVLTGEGVTRYAQQTTDVSPEFEHTVWHTLKVYREGKADDRLAATEFKPLQREPGLETQMLTGTVTYAAVLDDIRVGDVIEVAYTTHFNNPLFNGHTGGRYYIGDSSPIIRERYVIRLPLSMESARQSFELPPGTKDLPDAIFRLADLERAVTTTKTATEQVFTWEGTNLPAIEFDPLISPKCSPYWPVFRVTTFTTWADVVSWAQSLFTVPDTLPDVLNTQIAAWQKLDSEDKRLQAAVNWVENDIRYFALDIGVHNLKPRAIAEVCSSRFGDCKDKSLLLVAILRRLGFEAWPALANTVLRDRLHDLHPDTRAFNHAVVAYVHRGRLQWIDPTLREQHVTAGEYAFPPHGTALIIRPDENDLTDCTKPDLTQPDVETLDHIIVDAATGDAVLKTTVTLSGLQADEFRPTLTSVSNEERARNWYNFIGTFYPRLEELKRPTSKDVAGTNQIVQRAEYQLPNFVRKKDGRSGISIYAYALRAIIELPHSRRRHWPYAIAGQRYVRHRIEVDLPFDAKLEQQPEVIKAPGVEYRVERGANGYRLVVQHDLKITADYVAADEMPQFVDDIGEVMEAFSTGLTQPLPATP